jgi:hypothetical protein
MASLPDAHPDSVPPGPSDSPEQVTPPAEPGRENIEDLHDDSDGADENGMGSVMLVPEDHHDFGVRTNAIP